MQGDQLRNILARIESEILVVRQGWNSAEPVPLQENRHRTENQMQVLGMRNQRKEDQQSQRMRPPVRPTGRASLLHAERQKVRHHQQEDQQRDEAGFGRSTSRRNASPAMDTATAIANKATKQRYARTIA